MLPAVRAASAGPCTPGWCTSTARGLQPGDGRDLGLPGPLRTDRCSAPLAPTPQQQRFELLETHLIHTTKFYFTRPLCEVQMHTAMPMALQSGGEDGPLAQPEQRRGAERRHGDAPEGKLGRRSGERGKRRRHAGSQDSERQPAETADGQLLPRRNRLAFESGTTPIYVGIHYNNETNML